MGFCTQISTTQESGFIKGLFITIIPKEARFKLIGGKIVFLSKDDPEYNIGAPLTVVELD